MSYVNEEQHPVDVDAITDIVAEQLRNNGSIRLYNHRMSGEPQADDLFFMFGYMMTSRVANAVYESARARDELVMNADRLGALEIVLRRARIINAARGESTERPRLTRRPVKVAASL